MVVCPSRYEEVDTDKWVRFGSQSGEGHSILHASIGGREGQDSGDRAARRGALTRAGSIDCRLPTSGMTEESDFIR